MKNFPKKITVQIREEDRFFFGRNHFENKLSALLFRGFESEELFDFIDGENAGYFVQVSVHYNYFGKAHLTTYEFSGKLVDAKVEVRFIGDVYGAGQIEGFTIYLKRIEVPKVVFT